MKAGEFAAFKWVAVSEPFGRLRFQSLLGRWEPTLL